MMGTAEYLPDCARHLQIVMSSKLCTCWVLLNVEKNCLHHQEREACLPL